MWMTIEVQSCIDKERGTNASRYSRREEKNVKPVKSFKVFLGAISWTMAYNMSEDKAKFAQHD